MTRTAEFDFPAETKGWIRDGRLDVARFAANGLGIHLHDKQIELAQAIMARTASYYDLDWANRAGKTCVLCVLHMHQICYKPWLKSENREDWLNTEYRTLHTAPLNELAGRAHLALSEIIRGTSPAQRDEHGKRREAPLAPLYAAIKERDQAGADHMILKCLTGGVTDFRSTEGKAARLEGMSWWFITWDEWPATEGDPDTIRYVLNVRLTNRAADFNAPIILTGTRTPETEHVAKEFADKVDDPKQPDWWGNHAARSENPSHNKAALERALRNLDPEDYNRTVLGIEGGVKGRIVPSFLLDKLFTSDLPRFTPPDTHDGFRRSEVASEWAYLHLWDIAIAAADNIGMVLRFPANWQFGPDTPGIGVSIKRIPGSRTLTTAEITHTIEETFLPYGGRIVIDTTDAHGKGIARDLRASGYPIEDFTFNERPGLHVRGPVSPLRNIIRKDRAIKAMLTLLGEGLDFRKGADGTPIIGTDDVAQLDLTRPYGALRLPAAWTIVRDQLALLKPDDQRQRKDAAMAFLMGADVALRSRRAGQRPATQQHFSVFAGGHRG